MTPRLTSYHAEVVTARGPTNRELMGGRGLIRVLGLWVSFTPQTARHAHAIDNAVARRGLTARLAFSSSRASARQAARYEDEQRNVTECDPNQSASRRNVPRVRDEALALGSILPSEAPQLTTHPGRNDMITRRFLLQSAAAAAAYSAQGFPAAQAENAPGVTDTEIKIGQTMAGRCRPTAWPAAPNWPISK